MPSLQVTNSLGAPPPGAKGAGDGGTQAAPAARRTAFEPITPGIVKMYHCGPTVKEPVNINKFRSYLFADLLRRYFEFCGNEVRSVMNITDVGHLNEFEEDVIEMTASRFGKDPEQLVEEEIQDFHAHRRALRILDAHAYPQARDHVRDMIQYIQRLLDSGAAYRTDKNVYLDTTRIATFGRLTGRAREDLLALNDELAHRRPTDRRDPLDIDLWRTDVLHQIHWQSPWGRGFPGWHLECVVMSQKYLGPTFDIHTGTEENRFPHHECELAEAAALGDEPLARYWLHCAPVLLDGRPISRKNKNRLTVKALLEEGIRGIELRCALLATHYRQPIEFGPDSVDDAQRFLRRWQEAADRVRDRADSGGDQAATDAVERARREFRAALDDDLDVPRALEVALGLAEAFAGGRHRPTHAAWQAIQDFDRVLGLLS
jgi:cysteinyl-tRNA synthetase